MFSILGFFISAGIAAFMYLTGDALSGIGDGLLGIVISIGVGVGAAWLLSFLVVVSEKEAWVVEVFGKYNSTLHAGIATKPLWPIGMIVNREAISLKVQELGEAVGVKSSDNAFLIVPVNVQFRIIASKVKEAWYELEDPKQQISSYIINTVRSIASDMTLDQLFASKDAFENGVEKTLKEKIGNYGFEIVNVLVDDPQPSDALREAFEKELTAKHDLKAARLNREATRERIVGEAEAEADSLRLKAKAYVDMRAILAEGNSAALKKFCDGLEVTHSEALAYFAGLDMRDAIRDASQGEGSVILIPADMSGDNIGKIAALKKGME
jgi:regulator of protease activity HflC (stomatin/prohibitin superfamily)